MNMIKLAIALAIAMPAAVQAQTPAPPPPAEHRGDDPTRHGTMDHGAIDHGAMMDCCEGEEAERMACCERMRAQGHSMPCCEEAGEASGSTPE